MNRVTGRLGLFNIDGDQLSDGVIIAAYNNSEIDADIVRLSINDMIRSMTAIYLMKISTEFCIENGSWPPNPHIESAMCSNDAFLDWKKSGLPNYTSLNDVVLAYVDKIRYMGALMPNRNISPNDFVHNDQYVSAPYNIFPAREIKEYLYDKNDITHNLNDQLLLHMLDKRCKLEHNGVISGCSSHTEAGCLVFENIVKPVLKPKSTSLSRKNSIKEINRFVKTTNAKLAFLYNNEQRNSLLICVDKFNDGVARLWKAVDEIAAKSNTPLDCLVVDDAAFFDLVFDNFGNDAKRIVGNGDAIIGCGPRVQSSNTIPRFLSINDDLLLYNFEHYGFETISPYKRQNQNILFRPEYIIAAAYYKTNPRLYIAGVSVLLATADINWPLMLYLARKYGFVRTLYGLILETEKHKQIFDMPIKTLEKFGYVPIPAEADTVQDAMRVYCND